MNECPHPYCMALKPRTSYACKVHWLSLPTDIRKKISKGYKTSATDWLAANEEAQNFWKEKKP